MKVLTTFNKIKKNIFHSCINANRERAAVEQLVVRLTCNLTVVSSNPVSYSIDCAGTVKKLFISDIFYVDSNTLFVYSK